MVLSGIYAIEDARGYLYYGSSDNIKRRWNYYRSALNKGKYVNKKLQRAWTKYGETFFTFYVAEVVTDHSKLLEREQWWIDQLVLSEEWYYNESLTVGAPMKGRKHSDNTRKKMSESHTGMSNPSAVGNKHWVGRKHTDESKRKMSEKRKGRKRTADDIRENALRLSGGRVCAFIGPDGIVYENIINLRQFCREHGLEQANMKSLVQGKVKTVKGFRLLSITYLEEYKKVT